MLGMGLGLCAVVRLLVHAIPLSHRSLSLLTAGLPVEHPTPPLPLLHPHPLHRLSLDRGLIEPPRWPHLEPPAPPPPGHTAMPCTH